MFAPETNCKVTRPRITTKTNGARERLAHSLPITLVESRNVTRQTNVTSN
jgi:hypothetical protein